MRRIEPHAGLLAFLLGLVVLTVGTVVALTSTSLRLTGYNDAPLQIDVATVPAGGRACQPGAPRWEDTRAVRLGGRVDGPGPASVRVERPGSGGRRVASPWTSVQPGGPVVLALPRSYPSKADIALCVANRGPAALVLAGVAAELADRAAVRAADDEQSTGAGRFRVEGLASERPVRAWEVVDRLPERVATGTGVAIAPWLAVVGLIVALLAAAALLSRSQAVRDGG
jgi:hypothetical protein